MNATVSIPQNALSPMPESNVRVSVEALPASLFSSFFELDDDQLIQRGMRRVFAPENPGAGYPCRVSLEFARPGEELLLVNYRHLGMSTTPYRAEGPIFVRRNAVARPDDGTFPETVMHWAMAVRAYDHAGIMIEADIAEKDALQALTRTWLARPDVAHVDMHSMRRGCFFCRIRRG